MAETWRDRWPRGVLDPFCAQDHAVETPTDRRLLWHIEMAISPTNARQRQLADDIREYLDETCQHHWHEYAGDDDIPPHRQCMWCNDVEWADQPADGGTEK